MRSTGGDAGDGKTPAPADIEQLAEQRRHELCSLHQQADADSVNPDLVDRLFLLTDEVLELEERTRAARLQEQHRLSSRTIYGLLAGPVIVALMS